MWRVAFSLFAHVQAVVAVWLWFTAPACGRGLTVDLSGDSKNSRVVNPDSNIQSDAQAFDKINLQINENSFYPPFSLGFSGYSELLCVQDL
jgi:hypothetical protein